MKPEIPNGAEGKCALQSRKENSNEIYKMICKFLLLKKVTTHFSDIQRPGNKNLY